MKMIGKWSVLIVLGLFIAMVSLPSISVQAEETKVVASDAAPGNIFGSSVAIDGDIMVVGAPHVDDPPDIQTGAAYVYERSGLNTWTEVAVLTASDAATYHALGYRVAISGDTIVVGAPFDMTSAMAQGSAYVFEKPAGGWTSMTQTVKLTASDGAMNDEYGWWVDIDGDIIVVGARWDDDNEANSGSAYIYENTLGHWSTATETKILASDGAKWDQFGFTVAVEGGTVVVGAPFKSETYYYSGAVYVFEGGAGTWTQSAKLTADDPGSFNYFGRAIDISDGTIVAGSPGNYHNSIPTGAAYVFEEPATGWTDATQDAKLTHSDPPTGYYSDAFGWSVAIDGTTIAVGMWSDDDVDPSDPHADSGAVYIFKQQGVSWTDTTEDYKIIASDAAKIDYFGISVSIDGQYLAVGAPRVDDIVAGIDAGAAYVYFTNPGQGNPTSVPNAKANPNAFEGKNNRYDGKGNANK